MPKLSVTVITKDEAADIAEALKSVLWADEIVVEAFDLAGEGFELSIDDLASRAIQHETDHLDGVLFTDKLSEATQRELAPKMSDFESQFRRQQELGVVPSIPEIEAQLRRLAETQR